MKLHNVSASERRLYLSVLSEKEFSSINSDVDRDDDAIKR